MKRIAIIDDEADARQSLRLMLNSLCPDVYICGEANSMASAYRLIKQTRPQGILLDISMEDGTGFDLLDKFKSFDFQVIFTTAHDEFALEAFRYHALDYLLKPIVPADLAQSIARISGEIPDDWQEQVQHLLQSVRNRRFNKITLTSNEGMLFVDLDQIVHLESEGSYTTFHLLNKESHLTARPMKDFEAILPEEDFFKTHQSHIINLALIKKILREDGGYALMEDGCKIPISRRKKEAFLEMVRQMFR